MTARLVLARLAGSVALAVLAGCAGAPPSAPPPAAGKAAVPAADAGLAPVLRVEAGRADTLDAAPLGAGGAAAFGDHPDVTVVPVGGTRVAVTPRAGWAGIALVPFRVTGSAGAEGTIAVQAVRPGEAGGLRLRLVGVPDHDPSLVEFAVGRTDGSPIELDEEEGVVALVGDRPFGDNAIDAFEDYVFLDLDATGPGRQTVRLAVRTADETSDWLAVEVEGDRFVREVRPRVVGRGGDPR